jgi:hypothetical protein
MTPEAIASLVRARRLVWYGSRAALAAALVVPFVLIDAGDAAGRDSLAGAGVAALIGLPALAVLAGRLAFHRRPRLVLLLRTFGEASASRDLRKVIRRELAFVGITLTIADTHIRATGRGTEVLATVARLNPLTAWFAPARLRATTRDDLAALRGTLRRRARMVWLWLLAGSRVLVVPASDAFWQDAVRLLIDEADLVVVDASDTGPGAVWELQYLRRAATRAGVVFIAGSERLAVAQGLVSAFFPGQGAHVFEYRPDGSLARSDAFLRAVADRMRTS